MGFDWPLAGFSEFHRSLSYTGRPYIRRMAPLRCIESQSSDGSAARYPHPEAIMETRVTIKSICAGQPRAYADSQYIAEISSARHGVYTNDKTIDDYLTEEDALTIARMFVHGWCEDGEGDWASPRLKECIALKPPDKDFHKDGKKRSQLWRVKIVEAYTD